ncbi:hypothetical protein ACTHGU_17280 [Chitinophagaceae bacterium MMS25-I14]
MKKLSKNEMKNVFGGKALPPKPACLPVGSYCGSSCTDPETPVSCCPGSICSGGGIIAGKCIASTVASF